MSACRAIAAGLVLTWLLSVSVGCTTCSDPQGRVYYRGVVAADHLLGSQAGVEMLKLGGNAVDAAVATSFTQAVVRPYSCGLGGGGFMMIHFARRAADSDAGARGTQGEQAAPADSVLVYRETTPSGVGRSFYVDLDDPAASVTGRYAVGVPGTVAGLLRALEEYGTLDRATVLGPAIAAAERGYAIDADYVGAVRSAVRRLTENGRYDPSLFNDRELWVWQRLLFAGRPEVGDVLRQPELARTLRLIADEGAEVFYRGEIARALVAACPQMTSADLLGYEVQTTEPIVGKFLGRTFLTMPPPSSGGVALQQILGFLERHDDRLTGAGAADADYVHLIVEAFKHAFADRAEWLADARFIDVPIERLTSDEYIDDIAARFDPACTFEPSYYGSRAPAPDDHGTSHISVVDRWGNAVACTETINLGFGSLYALPEYGILLNNQMDDFLTRPGEANAFGLTQSARNLPEPGKRPLSSMSPTIVLDEKGAVEIVAGASGGPRIITGTLQVILNVMLHAMDPAKAVAQRRFHHQWSPDVLSVESGGIDANVRAELESRGHSVRQGGTVGNVQVIARAAEGDDTMRAEALGFRGASDPRKGGSAVGWQ